VAGALADAVVVLHLTVVAFIVFGGILAWRWPRTALVHLGFFAWGVAIELVGWTCPLTPLENALRRAAGEPGYSGGFVDRYVIPIVYPEGLGPGAGTVLAALLVAVNAVLYAPVAWGAWNRRRTRLALLRSRS
jgi:hypothetical protein